jgi:hypothetical protein
MKFKEIYTKVLKLWNTVFHKFFWSTLWTRSSLTTDGRPLHVHTAHNSRWISVALTFLAWRKPITTRISQLGGLSIVGHIITHPVDTRTNTRWQVIQMVYKAMSHVTLPRMRELSLAPTLVAKRNGGYFRIGLVYTRTPVFRCNYRIKLLISRIYFS